jgi:hypothetical protein
MYVDASGAQQRCELLDLALRTAQDGPVGLDDHGDPHEGGHDGGSPSDRPGTKGPARA